MAPADSDDERERRRFRPRSRSRSRIGPSTTNVTVVGGGGAVPAYSGGGSGYYPPPVGDPYYPGYYDDRRRYPDPRLYDDRRRIYDNRAVYPPRTIYDNRAVYPPPVTLVDGRPVYPPSTLVDGRPVYPPGTLVDGRPVYPPGTLVADDGRDLSPASPRRLIEPRRVPSIGGASIPATVVVSPAPGPVTAIGVTPGPVLVAGTTPGTTAVASAAPYRPIGAGPSPVAATVVTPSADTPASLIVNTPIRDENLALVQRTDKFDGVPQPARTEVVPLARSIPLSELPSPGPDSPEEEDEWRRQDRNYDAVLPEVVAMAAQAPILVPASTRDDAEKMGAVLKKARRAVRNVLTMPTRTFKEAAARLGLIDSPAARDAILEPVLGLTHAEMELSLTPLAVATVEALLPPASSEPEAVLDTTHFRRLPGAPKRAVVLHVRAFDTGYSKRGTVTSLTFEPLAGAVPEEAAGGLVDVMTGTARILTRGDFFKRSKVEQPGSGLKEEVLRATSVLFDYKDASGQQHHLALRAATPDLGPEAVSSGAMMLRAPVWVARLSSAFKKDEFYTPPSTALIVFDTAPAAAGSASLQAPVRAILFVREAHDAVDAGADQQGDAAALRASIAERRITYWLGEQASDQAYTEAALGAMARIACSACHHPQRRRAVREAQTGDALRRQHTNEGSAARLSAHMMMIGTATATDLDPGAKREAHNLARGYKAMLKAHREMLPAQSAEALRLAERRDEERLGAHLPINVRRIEREMRLQLLEHAVAVQQAAAEALRGESDEDAKTRFYDTLRDRAASLTESLVANLRLTLMAHKQTERDEIPHESDASWRASLSRLSALTTATSATMHALFDLEHEPQALAAAYAHTRSAPPRSLLGTTVDYWRRMHRHADRDSRRH